MASTSNVAEILTRVKSDKRALTQTLADMRLARTGLREMSNEAKAVDVSLARMGSGAMTLGMRLRGTTVPAIETAAREFAELRAQALAATSAMEQAGGVATAGRGSALSRLRGLSVETLGREIVGLPSVQLGPISSNDLGQGLRLAGQQGATFSGIASAMAPVVAIAAPLVAGFIALEHSMQGAKRALDAAVLANTKYYDLIGQGATTADLEGQIEQARNLAAAAQRELDVLTNGTEQGFDRLAESAGTGIAVLDDIGARFTMGLVTLTGADDAHAARVSELTQIIFNANAEIARFTAGIGAGETAAADMAAATEQWITDLQSHRDFLQTLSNSNLAAMAEEAAKAQEELDDAYARGIEKAHDLMVEINQVAAASEAKVADIKLKRDADLLKTETDAAGARIKLTEDAEIRRNRLIEDSNERIRKATAMAANALLMATGERDALAAFMAAQRRDEVIDEEKRSRDINERRLKEDLNRSIALNREAERKKLADQRAAAQAAINTEVAQSNAKLTVLRNQHAMEMLMLNALSLAVNNTVTSVNRSLASMFGNFGTPPQINLGPPPIPPTGGGITYPRSIPQFASGIDRVPRNMMAVIHQGEAVLNRRDAQTWRNGGATLNLNLNGATSRTIDIRSEEQAWKVFKEAMEYLGVR